MSKEPIEGGAVVEVAIAEHLRQKEGVIAYVKGAAPSAPAIHTVCVESECALGQVFESSSNGKCLDLSVLDGVCGSCEEFNEAASQVITLAETGQKELAVSELDKWFASASERFVKGMRRMQEVCMGKSKPKE